MSVLRGRRIAVTRAESGEDPLAAGLEALGAVPVRFPSIEIAPPESVEPLDDALRRISQYDWVVFTSANGVRATLGRFEQLGAPPARLADCRVAAVGPATAAELEKNGITGVAVPGVFTGSHVPAVVGEVSGRRFLLLRADRASGVLPDRLREAGGSVDDVIAYRTVPLRGQVSGPAADAIRRGIDAVTFTSPSTIEGFMNGVGEDWRAVVDRAVVATIGPVTSEAARAAGMTVDAEADPHTIEGLIAVLVRAFESRAAEGSNENR